MDDNGNITIMGVRPIDLKMSPEEMVGAMAILDVAIREGRRADLSYIFLRMRYTAYCGVSYMGVNMLVDGGAIKLLRRGMAKFRGVQEVQLAGLDVIFEMFEYGEEGAIQKMLDGGVVNVIMEAMTEHISSYSVVCTGMRALLELFVLKAEDGDRREWSTGFASVVHKLRSSAELRDLMEKVVEVFPKGYVAMEYTDDISFKRIAHTIIEGKTVVGNKG